MDYAAIILIVLGIVGTAGVLAAYYKRGNGNETVRLLQINVTAYQDAEKLKDQRIAYLEGQLVIKDETIKRLLNESR